MSRRDTERGFNRREFMSSALALGGMAVAASVVGPSNVWGAVSHKPLDPVNPDILFGSTSSLWSGARDIEWAIKRIAALGLQGIEPYAAQIEKYRSNPLALKKLFDDAGLTMIDVSNGAKGQSTNFIDPDQIPKTIADHVAFARDFLQPFGCTLWKCNMGARPAGGPSDDQLKRLANTLNEIGRQTIAMGIRLAPHPHIWGPMEREADVRRVMELTDPKYVWLTTDTGHLTLGGMDAVQDHERLLPAHRRGAPQGHLRQVSRQHLNADAGVSTRLRASITTWAAAASTSPPSSNCCATGTTRAGRFSTWMDRGRATTDSTPSAGTWSSPSMTTSRTTSTT